MVVRELHDLVSGDLSRRNRVDNQEMLDMLELEQGFKDEANRDAGILLDYIELDEPRDRELLKAILADNTSKYSYYRELRDWLAIRYASRQLKSNL